MQAELSDWESFLVGITTVKTVVDLMGGGQGHKPPYRDLKKRLTL